MNIEVRDEALRVSAGILAAKQRGSAVDASLLLDGFLGFAKERGVAQGTAWFQLFSGATHWGMALATEAAGERGVPVEVVLEECALGAAAWSAGG